MSRQSTRPRRIRRNTLVEGLPSNDQFRWIPRFYAVRGDKGVRWCLADSKGAAGTVYRRSAPATPRGTYLVIVAPSRDTLHHGAEFWRRSPTGADNLFYESRTDMVYGAELPWPGEPGYDQWYSE